MEQWNVVQKFCIYALPILFAITVHEAAHGYTARHFGDSTAERMGRLSLNPLRHIDPVGTVLLPLLALLMHAPLFGWAKPVPVDFSRLRSPKSDMLWVAAAGPASNLAMAVAWALLHKLSIGLAGNYLQLPLFLMSQAGVEINVVLMVLNLLPIPPLDGGRILVSLLPPPAAMVVARIEPFGFVIIIALLMTGVLWTIMLPFISAILHLFDLFF